MILEVERNLKKKSVDDAFKIYRERYFYEFSVDLAEKNGLKSVATYFNKFLEIFGDKEIVSVEQIKDCISNSSKISQFTKQIGRFHDFGGNLASKKFSKNIIAIRKQVIGGVIARKLTPKVVFDQYGTDESRYDILERLAFDTTKNPEKMAAEIGAFIVDTRLLMHTTTKEIEPKHDLFCDEYKKPSQLKNYYFSMAEYEGKKFISLTEKITEDSSSEMIHEILTEINAKIVKEIEKKLAPNYGFRIEGAREN